MTALLATVVGGALALDGVSFGQTMVSRPLVTGALIGLVLGDATTGITVGAILELYLLVAVPTGGGRFPDGSIAATVGSAAAIGVGGAPGVAAGVALGLVWGWLGGFSQSWLRRQNGARAVLASDGPVTTAAIRRSVLGGLGLDFARASVTCGLGIVVGWILLPVGTEGIDFPSGWVGALLLGGGMVSAGILLRTSVHRGSDWVVAATAAAIGWWVAGGAG